MDNNDSDFINMTVRQRDKAIQARCIAGKKVSDLEKQLAAARDEYALWDRQIGYLQNYLCIRGEGGRNAHEEGNHW